MVAAQLIAAGTTRRRSAWMVGGSVGASSSWPWIVPRSQVQVKLPASAPVAVSGRVGLAFAGLRLQPREFRAPNSPALRSIRKFIASRSRPGVQAARAATWPAAA